MIIDEFNTIDKTKKLLADIEAYLLKLPNYGSAENDLKNRIGEIYLKLENFRPYFLKEQVKKYQELNHSALKMQRFE